MLRRLANYLSLLDEMNNLIANRVLMSKVCAETKLKVPTQRYIHLLLEEVNQQLQAGDRTWFVDTETGASCNISQIEGISKRVASGLTKLGYGPGDVLQTGYSNCLDLIMRPDSSVTRWNR